MLLELIQQFEPYNIVVKDRWGYTNVFTPDQILMFEHRPKAHDREQEDINIQLKGKISVTLIGDEMYEFLQQYLAFYKQRDVNDKNASTKVG